MLNILFQPYPITADGKSNLRFNLGIGIFVATFLIVFQPFGTDQWITENKILKIIGYGIISFAVPMILYYVRNFIFRNIDIEGHYKVWHEVIWYLLILLGITLGNLFYARCLGINDATLNSFLATAGIVASVGFFPILASILIKHHQYLAINQKSAQTMEKYLLDLQAQENANTENSIEIHFVAENEKDILVIDPHDLLYIESQDNYSAFYYFRGGNLKKELLRGPLKRFEAQINSPSITRCHRSYIVNLHKVEHISGNAQGYQLSLNHEKINIPVSRTYSGRITQLLDK